MKSSLPLLMGRKPEARNRVALEALEPRDQRELHRAVLVATVTREDEHGELRLQHLAGLGVSEASDMFAELDAGILDEAVEACCPAPSSVDDSPLTPQVGSSST